jgi:hypothetical protein
VPSVAELSILLTAQNSASAQLRALGGDVQRLERQVEGVQRRTGGGLLGGVSLGAGFAAAQAALGGMQGLFDAIGESIFGMNSRLEQTVATFEALSGSASRAQQIVQALRQEAATSPFSDQEVLAAGRALVSSAQGSTDALLDLVRVAEQLAAVDPAQGLEGASVALREAMSGDFTSLIQRFELSRAAIQRFREQGLSNLEAVRAELQRIGVTSELVERLGQTFEGRRATIVSFFDELRQRLGAGIFERVSDAFGHMVNLIAEHGDRLRRLATDIGEALGAILERVAAATLGPLRALVEAFAPGLWAQVAAELERVPEPVQEIARAAQQAAPAAQSLERQLAGVGVAAAGIQIEANRVRQSYEAQIQPLERQLRVLQQSADLQRVQNALASNRAAVENIRLTAETAALRRAAGGATDPNAAGLSTRQRLIALALQERELRQQELGLEEQRRPALQSVEQQLAALQEQQRQALAPLEEQLALYRNQADVLQLQRQQAALLKEDMEQAAEAVRRAGTGEAAPEALADSRQRGEALAAEWLTGFEDWINAGGGTVWGAIGRSLQAWYDGTGKALAQTIGTDLGTALAEAAGVAVEAGVRSRLAAVFANPLVAGLLGGAAQGLSPAGAALPQVAGAVAAQGSAIGQQGVTVDFGAGSIVIGGVTDPGFGERLKAALTDFLNAFVLASANVEPGARAGLQGAGRAP